MTAVNATSFSTQMLVTPNISMWSYKAARYLVTTFNPFLNSPSKNYTLNDTINPQNTSIPDIGLELSGLALEKIHSLSKQDQAAWDNFTQKIQERNNRALSQTQVEVRIPGTYVTAHDIINIRMKRHPKFNPFSETTPSTRTTTTEIPAMLYAQ